MPALKGGFVSYLRHVTPSVTPFWHLACWELPGHPISTACGRVGDAMKFYKNRAPAQADVSYEVRHFRTTVSTSVADDRGIPSGPGGTARTFRFALPTGARVRYQSDEKAGSVSPR